MLKLRFKHNSKPSKNVIRNKNVTVVTLRGIVDLNCYFPSTYKTIGSHPFLENYSLHPNFCVVGVAKLSPNDKDNPILAERIAESRAKIKLYKFAKWICSKYLDYLENELSGYKNNLDNPTPKQWKKGSAWGDFLKYDDLMIREMDHLNELLDEV